MKFGLLIVNLICIVDSTYVKCGPDESCRCHHINVMDCSGNETLQLRRVCDFIYDFRNVTDLNLEGNGYKHIRKEDIKGCSSLKSLFLGNNKVSNVDKFSFANFGNLETLDISFNQLNVNDFIWKLLTTPPPLKKLMLHGNLNVAYKNDTVTLYPNLSNLTYLEILVLDGTKDKIFPVSYREMATLYTVSLSGLNGNCSIPYISNATFQNLQHVRLLNLSSCGTLNIEAGAFKSLVNLEVLDLSQNMNLGLRILSNVSYSLQFTNIKSLNFSKVYTTYGMGTRLQLQDVCYLWNTSLTELVLNSNRIELIETNALILIPKDLKIIRAEDNKFTYGRYISQLRCLSELEEFYGNYQNGAHDPSLYSTEPLDNVIISTNSSCPFARSLYNISKSKEHCYYFKENINIGIPPTFPALLKIVEFSTCGMVYALPKLPLELTFSKLEYLDGSGNVLYSWGGPIGKFPNIKYLNLSRNYCSHIGKEFFDSFASVENLQIQENFLGLVLSNHDYGPVVFDKLGNVTVLNLSSNIISYLHPDVFSNMPMLMTLDLSVNNIESFDIDVSNLNNLLHLNLKFNFIKSLPSSLLEKLESNAKRLKRNFTIDLSSNTILIGCDHDDVNFLKWIVHHKTSMVNFDKYVFHSKSNHLISVEQFIKEVNNLDKDCRKYTSIIVACSMGLSVFLTVVIGGIVYKNRWKLRYLMRMNKIKNFGYTRLHQLPNEVEMFLYDAFISYANDDLRFILNQMTPKLEERGNKICLHDRDFLPGNNIADNILQAIRDSRKTVVVLSKGFMKSKWCLFEFNMARMESIYARGGNSCLIVVMLENVPTRNMSNEMLDWMKSNTYIEYTTEPEGELLFWDNFLQALNE